MSALTGFKVLELSEGVAGEYCGKLLADFGAEIIKIEKPGTGSPTRAMGPFVGRKTDGENSGLFAYLNTNKRSVALDIKGKVGRATLHKLVAGADVVIDDHDVDWLKRLQLAPAQFEAQYPNTILCSVTPFGLDAPKEWRNARSLNVFHMSGWGYHTPTNAHPARPPLKGPGRFLADYEGALDAALAIVSTLYWRNRSKKGQTIDVSQIGALISRADLVIGRMLAGEQAVTTDRTAYDMTGPSAFFSTTDGAVYFFATTVKHWKALCELMGNPDWALAFPENWLEFGVTKERVAAFRAQFAIWMQTQQRHDVSDKAQKLGVPIVAVNDASDLPASTQFQHRGFFQKVSHPTLGEALYPTVPYRMSASPATITSAAPILGADTDDVFERAAIAQDASA